MKEATVSHIGLVCGWCDAVLEDENSVTQIECSNCDNSFGVGDDIICCDAELPRSVNNPISPQRAPHYCSQECYDEDKDKREQYYQDLIKERAR